MTRNTHGKLPLPGRRIVLLRPHPFAGQAGQVVDRRTTLGASSVRVQLDSGPLCVLVSSMAWRYE